ncbi:hypothetical protein LPTSP3_g22560 [Leptospira kobayashii]|uniref:Uncharacterized protein n=1 Tax=Leptospira kobayashii TaxID=1917830 RepID=A0ABM7UKF6_9LEPT|nr:hypothetical protein [Leptospira kobayashii]BDA79326.1 hypothetical protein LPTSP3_g22560 [Leptospira kobayashii]
MAFLKNLFSKYFNFDHFLPLFAYSFGFALILLTVHTFSVYFELKRSNPNYSPSGRNIGSVHKDKSEKEKIQSQIRQIQTIERRNKNINELKSFAKWYCFLLNHLNEKFDLPDSLLPENKNALDLLKLFQTKREKNLTPEQISFLILSDYNDHKLSDAFIPQKQTFIEIAGVSSFYPDLFFAKDIWENLAKDPDRLYRLLVLILETKESYNDTDPSHIDSDLWTYTLSEYRFHFKEIFEMKAKDERTYMLNVNYKVIQIESIP